MLKDLASSMIDISDGLAQDLGHILKASQVGAVISLNNLPINTTIHTLKPEKQWQYALSGGDDYELCFTISTQNYQKLLQLQPNVQTTIIGKIKAQHGLTFEKDGLDHPLHFHGYQHFA